MSVPILFQKILITALIGCSMLENYKDHIRKYFESTDTTSPPPFSEFQEGNKKYFAQSIMEASTDLRVINNETGVDRLFKGYCQHVAAAVYWSNFKMEDPGVDKSDEKAYKCCSEVDGRVFFKNAIHRGPINEDLKIQGQFAYVKRNECTYLLVRKLPNTMTKLEFDKIIVMPDRSLQPEEGHTIILCDDNHHLVGQSCQKCSCNFANAHPKCHGDICICKTGYSGQSCEIQDQIINSDLESDGDGGHKESVPVTPLTNLIDIKDLTLEEKRIIEKQAIPFVARADILIKYYERDGSNGYKVNVAFANRTTMALCNRHTFFTKITEKTMCAQLPLNVTAKSFTVSKMSSASINGIPVKIIDGVSNDVGELKSSFLPLTVRDGVKSEYSTSPGINYGKCLGPRHQPLKIMFLRDEIRLIEEVGTISPTPIL